MTLQEMKDQLDAMMIDLASKREEMASLGIEDSEYDLREAERHIDMAIDSLSNAS